MNGPTTLRMTNPTRSSPDIATYVSRVASRMMSSETANERPSVRQGSDDDMSSAHQFASSRLSSRRNVGASVTPESTSPS